MLVHETTRSWGTHEGVTTSSRQKLGCVSNRDREIRELQEVERVAIEEIRHWRGRAQCWESEARERGRRLRELEAWIVRQGAFVRER